MVNIKICGLRTLEDIQAVNEARPDYIGFVFAPGKRQVTASQAAAMKDHLAPGIQAIGVFVNESVDRILSLAEAGIIDMIQLHGPSGYGQLMTSTGPSQSQATICCLTPTQKTPTAEAVRPLTGPAFPLWNGPTFWQAG